MHTYTHKIKNKRESLKKKTGQVVAHAFSPGTQEVQAVGRWISEFSATVRATRETLSQKIKTNKQASKPKMPENIAGAQSADLLCVSGPGFNSFADQYSRESQGPVAAPGITQ